MFSTPEDNSNFSTPGEESRSILNLWTKLSAHQKSLLINDQHAIMLVDLLEKTFNEWRCAAAENTRNLQLIGHLQRQCANYEDELKRCQTELRHANSEMAARNAHIRALEEELAQYAERFKAARVQFQAAAMTIPQLTADNNENDNGKHFKTDFPRKRAKRLFEDNFEKQPQPNLSATDSDSNMFGDDTRETPTPRKKNKPAEGYPTSGTITARLTPLVDYGNGWDNDLVGQRSAHNFITNNNLLNAAFSHCNVCTRNLGMRSLKCNGCKLQIHENCRPNAPIACLPTTPKCIPKFHPIATGTSITTSRFLIPKRLNFTAEQPSKQHRQSRIQPMVKASSTCELDNSQPLLGPLFGEKQNQPLVQRITKANLGQLY